MKLAGGYIRCSTEMQEDSPDQQRKELLAFAAQNSIKIIEWFTDFGRSGTTFEQRPEFQRLKSTVESGKCTFSVVLCYDESRWGRSIDSEENTYYRVCFRKCGVNVLLVHTSVDPKNEFAPMLSAFEGVQASQFSKKLSELTIRGAKNNGVYSNGGSAPYGYIRIAENTRTGIRRELHHGDWCIKSQEKVRWALGDEEEIRVVKFIFEQRATGMAAVLIAKALNQKNTPCPKRGRWRNKDQKWSGITICTIVRNHTYYGARRYNENSMSKIQARLKGRPMNPAKQYPHWRNDAEDIVTTQEAHPAIVSKELWNQANAFQSKKHYEPRNRFTHSSNYLLTGLMKCSRCGFPFQGQSTRADGKDYSKYVDGGWTNKRVCSHLGIRKDYIEPFAIQCVKDTLSDPTLMRSIERELKALIDEGPNVLNNEKARLAKALEENRQKLKRYTDLVERGVGIDTIIERFRELEEEKEQLKKLHNEAVSKSFDSMNSQDLAGMVAGFIQNFAENFEKAPIEERKLLMKQVISEIIVDRDAETVIFHVRKIPAIIPDLEELLQTKRLPADAFASSQSSGGRT